MKKLEKLKELINKKIERFQRYQKQDKSDLSTITDESTRELYEEMISRRSARIQELEFVLDMIEDL